MSIVSLQKSIKIELFLIEMLLDKIHEEKSQKGQNVFGTKNLFQFSSIERIVENTVTSKKEGNQVMIEVLRRKLVSLATVVNSVKGFEDRSLTLRRVPIVFQKFRRITSNQLINLLPSNLLINLI